MLACACVGLVLPGLCGGPGATACTWRVVSVDKIVQRSCHVRVFGAQVAASIF